MTKRCRSIIDLPVNPLEIIVAFQWSAVPVRSSSSTRASGKVAVILAVMSSARMANLYTDTSRCGDHFVLRDTGGQLVIHGVPNAPGPTHTS